MGLLEAVANVVRALLCAGQGDRKDNYTPEKPHEAQAPPHKQEEQAQHPGGYPPAQKPHEPPYHPPKPAQAPYHSPSPEHVKKRYDDNQVNQQNNHYRDLRSRANEAGEAMGRCFSDSKQAYESGDGARAKELSNEGKEHQAEMDKLNKEASAWIYKENNLDSAPHEIDLHGLYVKEAIHYTEQAIEAAQKRGDPSIHLIVGKGLHSQGRVAKIKPAIEELIVKYRLAAQLDPHNEGVLIVQLNAEERGETGMDADEIGRRLEKNEESCIIM